MTRLRVPGVVRAHDLGRDERTGAPFLVEEYVAGVTLIPGGGGQFDVHLDQELIFSNKDAHVYGRHMELYPARFESVFLAAPLNSRRLAVQSIEKSGGLRFTQIGDEREMIANVFELSEYKVSELMVPLSERVQRALSWRWT